MSNKTLTTILAALSALVVSAGVAWATLQTADCSGTDSVTDAGSAGADSGDDTDAGSDR